MKPIVMLMLAVQAGIILVAVWTVLKAPDAGERKPVWSGLAVALAIIAGTSIRIADTHAGQPGADILEVGAPLLLGMALMAVLLILRERRSVS
jgi:hypothetical protein